MRAHGFKTHWNTRWNGAPQVFCSTGSKIILDARTRINNQAILLWKLRIRAHGRRQAIRAQRNGAIITIA